MKAEIEFSVDRSGNPIIKIKHLDRNKSLDQILLGAFIERAQMNGIVLVPTGGFLEINSDNSFEDYIIEIKKP